MTYNKFESTMEQGNGDSLSQRVHNNAGADLVLEAKGSWIHAGYHLTSATAGPALLSLPFAFTLVGWGPGVLALLLGSGISFYAYYLLIVVLEHLESQGKRFIRYRDLADHVLGTRWSFYLIAPLQFTICFVTVIGAVLVGGVCMKEINLVYQATNLKLSEFILIFGALTALLAQLPSFHSLRHVNFVSLVLCFGYSICATSGSIIVGMYYVSCLHLQDGNEWLFLAFLMRLSDFDIKLGTYPQNGVGHSDILKVMLVPIICSVTHSCHLWVIDKIPKGKTG